MKQRGFTILEIVIYIALFSMLMSGVLITVFQLLEAGEHNRIAIATQEEGTFVNRKISWALAGATDATIPDAKTLRITRPDLGAQSPIEFTEVSGQILISRGGAAGVALTTSELTVSNMNVSTIPSGAGVPESVRVSYEIEGYPFLFISYLRF